MVKRKATKVTRTGGERQFVGRNPASISGELGLSERKGGGGGGEFWTVCTQESREWIRGSGNDLLVAMSKGKYMSRDSDEHCSV